MPLPVFPEAHRKCVLIVEDNALSMKLFHDLLEMNGYDTITSGSGSDALHIVRQHRPDLILMDIQLPGISGFEITRQIKEDQEIKMIPIIAVTAFAMKSDEKKIREGGFEDYISKPISITNFIDIIKKYIY